MLSHLDPSLHDPAPYPTLIRTSYPCQPTPHTQGIPSLPSPALLCAFFDLPVHFRTPTISFRFAPQPALFHPPAFVLTPRRLGALSAVGALRRRRPALCARDVVPRFRADFDFRRFSSSFRFDPIFRADTARLPGHPIVHYNHYQLTRPGACLIISIHARLRVKFSSDHALSDRPFRQFNRWYSDC